MNTDKKSNQKPQSDQWALDDQSLNYFAVHMFIFIKNNFKIIFFVIAASMLFSALILINTPSTYVGRAVFKSPAFNFHDMSDAPIEILVRLDAQIKSLAIDELKCSEQPPLIVGIDSYTRAKLIGEILVIGREKGAVVDCVKFLLERIKEDNINAGNLYKKIITDRLKNIKKGENYILTDSLNEASVLNNYLIYIEVNRFEILRQPYIEKSQEKFLNSLKKLFFGAFVGLVLGVVIAKLIDVMKRDNNKTINKSTLNKNS
jgi:hypothetical protein